MQDTIYRITEEMCKSEEEWLEEIYRTKVIPPIKGKITLGKIRWRGLVICSQQDQDTAIPNGSIVQMKWVEQRGRKITPIFLSEVRAML